MFHCKLLISLFFYIYIYYRTLYIASKLTKIPNIMSLKPRFLIVEETLRFRTLIFTYVSVLRICLCLDSALLHNRQLNSSIPNQSVSKFYWYYYHEERSYLDPTSWSYYPFQQPNNSHSLRSRPSYP